MSYLFLTIAIIAEVIATSALKASQGFSVLIPSIITILGYAVALFFLSLTLKYCLRDLVRCRHCANFNGWMDFLQTTFGFSCNHRAWANGGWNYCNQRFLQQSAYLRP